MALTSIRLQNYRSYEDSSFEFAPGVNIIVGPNASGKTNLLDAIYFIARGTTFKKHKDGIIRDKQQWARLDCLTESNITRSVKVTPNNTQIIIDDKPFTRLSPARQYPVVLFEPNHLYQITTSPEMRRSYVDDLLARTSRDFPGVKSRYVRTLQQRNALLKNHSSTHEQLFPWNIRLSELAGSYTEHRNKAIKNINQRAPQLYSQIAGSGSSVQLEIDSRVSKKTYADNMMKLLEETTHQDKILGFTSIGPHRDDIRIELNNKHIKEAASRGETRSVLLAMKLAEAELLEEATNKKPFMLLDDVFGELDGSRRKALISFMKNNQVFITTTDADIIGHEFAKEAQIVAIE